MTENNFTATVRLENGAPVLDLQGDINAYAEAALNAAYAEAEKTPAASVTLNFEKVDYINSTGIALIVGLLAKARAAHRAIIANGLTEHYREIFTITRLSDFMEIH